MSTNKPRVLIIGAGMAGLTAAHKLHTSSNDAFDIHVAEGGDRIGGRINTAVFCGDQVEMGATWIHGIEGSPVYRMAKELNSLESTRPWECMDGSHGGPITVAENGYELNYNIVKSVSKYFDALMDFAQGKEIEQNRINDSELAKRANEVKEIEKNGMDYCELAKRVYEKKEIEQNGMNYCELAKRVWESETKEIEKNGMDYYEMSERVCETKEIEQNGMDYCEMAKRAFEKKEIEQKGVDYCEMANESKEIEQNGMNYSEMAERAYEKKEIEQNGMNYCEMAKKVCETKEIKQNGMDYSEMAKRAYEKKGIEQNGINYFELAKRAYEICAKNGGFQKISIGGFLRKGLELYKEEVKGFCEIDQELIFDAIFEMKENTQRTYTSADDLAMLDFEAEREYKMFSGKEITIAKGYMSIIEHLASVLPNGCVKLGKKVVKIEWRSEDSGGLERENGGEIRAVKVNFSDGSYIFTDHVILTVSLGVLKASVCKNLGIFDPPLPNFKIDAISRLGFGVVNKLFMELLPSGFENENENNFPFLQMVFQKMDSELRSSKVPLWMRKTNSLCPIYGKSNVLLSWFAGKEALELESLEDEEIIKGVSNTLSCFTKKTEININSSFGKVLTTRWENDPLFLGSYSYVAVGSSGDDLDTMAVPLPENGKNGKNGNNFRFPLQILFAGEATHRTHYSTTHGAYFSGLREANRLLQHYGL